MNCDLHESKKKYRKHIVRITVLYLIFSLIFTYFYIYRRIPDKITIMDGRSETQKIDLPMNMHLFIEKDKKHFQVTPKLFGLIGLKTIEVSVMEQTKLIPSGIPVGVYLKTSGLMVIGSGEILDESGMQQEPAKGILFAGDYILSLDNSEVHSINDLAEMVAIKHGREVTLKVLRNNKVENITVHPVKTKSGNYKLGIWVREDSQGIGTLTYLTPDGKYGALGHGISDPDTGELLSVEGGILYKANIWGLVPNQKNQVGGVCGNIIYERSNQLGSILKNCRQGIYGQAFSKLKKDNQFTPYQIGLKQEVKKGKAQIISSVSGKREVYDVEILDTNMAAEDKNKGMTIRVTDKRLLVLTNGIIQGMSGSPIIQDGKIIGAVTHVFVKDSSKGYGIFIENMLENQ